MSVQPGQASHPVVGVVPDRCTVHAVGVSDDVAMLPQQPPVAPVVIDMRIPEPTDADRFVVVDLERHPLTRIKVFLAFIETLDHPIDDVFNRDVFIRYDWQLDFWRVQSVLRNDTSQRSSRDPQEACCL